MRYLFALLLLLLVVPAYADTTISDAQFRYTIAGGEVLVEQRFSFSEPFTAQFEIPLPTDFTELVVSQNGNPIEVAKLNGYAKFLTREASLVSIRYHTKHPLSGESFVSSISAPLGADAVHISLTLPPRALVRGTEGVPSSGVYPSPTQITSDGESLTITWDKGALPAGEELTLYVRYRQSRETLLWVFIALGIGIVLLLFFFRKKTTTPQPIHPPSTLHSHTSSMSDVTKHLKEDEQQVVTILRNREGTCEQGTLRVITGFSKAKLSGLLFELEQRKIIHKEKKGKKNLVFLKEL